MKNHILTALLVLLLLSIIYFSGSVYITSLPFVVIQMVAILVIFWAVLVKKLHRRTTSRVPHKDGVYFLKEGPYEFIRHPIYTGLLLFASSYVQEYVTILGGLAFLLFVGVLYVRIGDDERLNEVYFKHEFMKYKENTKKLIPYIY